MARFGDFKAIFFARGNLSTPLADSDGVTFRVPLSGSTNAVMNAEGRTELVFGYDAKFTELAVAGRVCVCYQYDSVADPPYIGGVSFCLPFFIESVAPVEPGLVRIEGPDLLSQLKDLQWYSPIGAGTTTNTTVAVAVADPVSTTLAAGSPHNNDSMILASVTGWEEGDEARVTLDNGAVHVAVVKSVNPPGSPAGSVQLLSRFPSDAASGNAASRRKRKVKVAAGQGAAFVVGAECRLTLDDNTTHTTVIAEAPEADVITMRDGAPDGAAIGKAIQAKDFSQPTTSDVTTIMSYMSGWSVDFDSGGYTGTADGTHHAPAGESVYDLLVATAKQTGEFFRLRDVGPSVAPARTVVWKRNFDYAGYGGTNLRLVQPAQASVDADAANVNRAIITGDVERESVFQPVTRIVPFAGDKRITLALCSQAARLQATVEGLTLVDTGLGLYTPPYLVNTSAESSLGVIGRAVTFSHIRTETDSAIEWQSAADELMRAAIAYLYEHGTAARTRYVVDGVVSALPVQVGQRVEMVYASPDGRWNVNAIGANALYVMEVRADLTAAGESADGNITAGMKLMTLTLLESPWDVPTVEATTAAAVVEVARLARQVGGGLEGASSVILADGGGGGVTDHGALTGLADDDHPQYVRVDGTRAMTGNLQMGAGLMVDGVDISAHAADPNAHHAAVTATDMSVALSGQAVRVRPGTNAALSVDATGLIVIVKNDGGLETTASGLGVKLPTNSGLATAAAGLALGTPGTLTASSSNAVSAASHTHAVTSTNDASGGTATTLLSSTSEGGLGLARLGVGVTPSAAAALYARAKATDDYTLWLKQLTGQTADMWRVEDVAGNALIRLTGGGDLESGYPGFVSRVTGWQIEHGGNAEFNNVFIRGELHAATFVADEMHATGGTLAVMTVAKVAAAQNAGENVLPALGSTFTLNVQASWDSGLCYFAVNDIVRIKPMGEIPAGGSLDLYDIYVQVQATGNLTGRNLANGNAGYFPMTVYRRNGGATNFEIPAGCAAVKWARASGSGYTGGLILTSDLQYSPYVDLFTIDATQSGATWQSAPVTPKPRVRLGNLRGVLGKSADEWGLAAGVDLSDTAVTAPYIVASDLGFTMRNVDFRAYNGTAQTAKIQANGAMSLGSDIGAAATTTFEFVASTGALRVGPAGAGTANLFWNGSALQLRQNTTAVIALDSDGSSYFAGPMTIGASGGIWQGTGTFATPTTGLKLFRSGSVGVLASYSGGVPQARIDTDGAFKTGWNGTTWDVIMGSDGIVISAPNTDGTMPTFAATKRITWNYGGTAIGWVGGRNISVWGWRGVELMADLTVGVRMMYDAGGGAQSTMSGQQSIVFSTSEAAGWLEFESEARFEKDVIGVDAQFDVVVAQDMLYAQSTLVVGGSPASMSDQVTGVLAMQSRTTHAPNPAANDTIYLYVYKNAGTSKQELWLRGRTGTTVKLGEVPV